MQNTLRLVQRLKHALPTKSNYAIAKALEMDQSSLNRVLAGKMGLGPKAVIKLSELLQISVRDVLVLVEEDKAKRPKDVEFWGRRSPRIQAAIAVTALAFGAALFGRDARAMTCLYKSPVAIGQAIHYVK